MDKYPKYISEEQQESFELFLSGKMSVEQQDSFKLSLNQDSQLQESFEEFKLLFIAIEEEGLRSKLEDFHTTIEEETPVRQLNASKKRFNYSIAASVAILIAIGGVWFFNRQSPNEKLFHKYYTQDPGLPTVMGSNDNFDFYEAMVDYKRGDYDVAIEKWKKLVETKPKNDTLNYFLGVSYLALENTPKALIYLETIAKNKNSVFMNEAQIYLGLAHIKSNQIQNAKAIFTKIDTRKSREILSEIK